MTEKNRQDMTRKKKNRQDIDISWMFWLNLSEHGQKKIGRMMDDGFHTFIDKIIPRLPTELYNMC